MELRSPWREFAEAMGGVAKLAKFLDVDRGTVRRWASGELVPSKLVQEHVRQLISEHVKLPRGAKPLPDPWK